MRSEGSVFQLTAHAAVSGGKIISPANGCSSPMYWPLLLVGTIDFRLTSRHSPFRLLFNFRPISRPTSVLSLGQLIGLRRVNYAIEQDNNGAICKVPPTLSSNQLHNHFDTLYVLMLYPKNG
jgi:hypothetical protein